MGQLTEDRGQMLLIGGVLLAVSIIALAIVFNGAIYTSVLAGEGSDDISGPSAITVQQDVHRIGDELVAEAIEQRSGNTAQADYVSDHITSINRSLEQYEAEFGRIIDISHNSSIGGHYISNSSNSFTNQSGVGNWELLTDGRVRNFTLTVDTAPGDTAFEVRETSATGPPDRYRINISSGSEITVYESSAGTYYSSVGTCSASSPMHVGITNGTINGQQCNALDFFERIESPYDIEIFEGNGATGGYNLTVAGGTIASDMPSSNTNVNQLYGVTLDIEYYTTEMDYNSTVRIAPGEPS